MATQTGHLRLTYEDYRLIPDDGKRHELIDGEHVISPPPNTKHQRIAGTLLTALANFLRDHPLGEIFIAPYDVVLSDFDVVQPDLIFVATAQAAIVTEANIRGIPTLVVETLSEGNRKLDETIKRQRYEHYGIHRPGTGLGENIPSHRRSLRPSLGPELGSPRPPHHATTACPEPATSNAV